LLFTPIGFEEPVWWRNSRCTILRALIIKGSKKCNVKKRVKVAFLTENPPQSQRTISLPTTGIAEAKLVMTVAPQKDICPQGNTYPKKAVPISKRRITTPTLQVSLKWYEP